MAGGTPRLFRKKDSRFYWAEIYVDGRRVRFSTGTTRAAEALTRARERLHSHGNSSFTLRDVLKLRGFDLRADLRLGKLRRRTVLGLESLHGALLAGLDPDMPAAEATADVVKAFLVSKSWSNGYRHRLLRELRAALRLAYKRKRIAEPVHEDLAGIVEREEPKVDTLTREEVEALIAAVGPAWLKRFLILVDATGARLNELLGARCADVELNGGGAAIIRVEAARAKSRRARHVHVQSERGLRALQDQLAEPGAYLFTSSRPRDDGAPAPYTDALVQDLVQKALKEIGAYRPGRGVHALRRSLVSDMVREGVPIEHAAAIVGHSSLQTTRAHYVAAGAIESAALRSLERVRGD